VPRLEIVRFGVVNRELANVNPEMPLIVFVPE
jgi:hypothetical protein